MQRFIVTILGKAGSGKTTLIKKLVLLVPRPVFILDTLNEFNDGLVFESASHLRQFLVTGSRNDSHSYVLKSTSDKDSAGFFEIVATLQSPCTMIVDEVSLFCTPYKIDDNLNRIIQYGRHWETNIICAARRASEINRNLTAQSDCIISFRQTEKIDVSQLKLTSERAGYLPRLDFEKREYIVLGDYEHLPFAKSLNPAMPVPKSRIIRSGKIAENAGGADNNAVGKSANQFPASPFRRHER